MDKKHIYVELDSLFDTRLILAWIMDPRSVVPYVESGSYFVRVKDNMGNISADIFNTMYKERNKLLLRQALPTKLFIYLKDHYGELITDIVDVTGNDIYIYVNVYPYDLTDIELENIRTFIVDYIPKSVIKFVNMSPYEVTPKWLNKHVGNIYMYNLLPWIEHYTSTTEIFTSNLLNSVCVGPAIANYNIPEHKIDRQFFEDLMTTFRLYSNVYLISAELFSANVKPEELVVMEK